MLKRLLGYFVFFLVALHVQADEGNYAVSLIPPALLKNADAVMRTEELQFEIINKREAIKSYHYVVTILNENGDDWAEFTETYDRLHDIVSLQGHLYDAAGRHLKKMKLKDAEDLSAVTDISLIDDNRIRRHNFYYKTYPYTVEYEVRVKYKHTLFFPAWIPQGSDRIAIEKSNVSIVCPMDYQFRYKAFHYNGGPVVTTGNKKKVSIWEVSGMPAMLKEIYQPPVYDRSTVVLFAPTEFQVGDYTGSMQNWKDFGKFIYNLNLGRDILPANIKAKVHQLVDSIRDAREKVQVLYEYMQQNTRYISIQLGIGGWQPLDANFVAAKSYGDCKALTNYMYSLLKEAGIPSCYTVVRAGRDADSIEEDFPSQQFNHVILCVPFKSDTLWLECTSQTAPAGYLGGFAGNRYALVINENGGTLVSTPGYRLTENLQMRKINARLGEDGTLHLQSNASYRAIQQDDLHSIIHSLSKEKLKEYLHKELDFVTYEIDDFSYRENKGALPVIDEALDIRVSNYATITGRRIFVSPDIMNRSYVRFTEDTARQSDIDIGYDYRDIDTVEIQIPPGYQAETMPPDQELKSRFGEYKCSVKLEEDKLLYYRSFAHYSGRFTAADYNELVNFYETIYKADREKVVLVKQ